jgi:hypothetical protein
MFGGTRSEFVAGKLTDTFSKVGLAILNLAKSLPDYAEFLYVRKT